MADFVDLAHHGDVEATPGLLDLAVNVYPGPRPPWLDEALRASLDDVDRYPDAAPAEAALARHHGRAEGEVLATAGAAEAFTLLARLHHWQKPVVVHPQFTEPHAALVNAGHQVTEVVLEAPFTLDPDQVPDDADLVFVGNPTNPTGIRHPAASLLALRRPGRLLVVDEAFIDTEPGEPQSLSTVEDPGLVVIRSLTKHWSVPGIRAGYLLAPPDVVRELRALQAPWSVSTPAAAAMIAVATPRGRTEADRRARDLVVWRHHLERGLAGIGVPYLPSSASFVLARPGDGVHARLREAGVAVRRCDTFPGLGGDHLRIAVRPPEASDALLRTLRGAR